MYRNNTDSRFIFYSEYLTPNNWIFNRPENMTLPYVDLIKNNVDLILNAQNELFCIRCTKEIDFQNYGGIEHYCYLNTVFCPECEMNMIVPKSRIPDPFDDNLNMWHVLAFGLFANRPISESEYEIDSDPEMELENNNEISSLPYMNLATNNKDQIINDSEGGVCIWCYKKMTTSEDINKIESGGRDVCCNYCGIDAVVPISKVPEPFEYTLENWRCLGFS